jgi:hypothetical protein
VGSKTCEVLTRENMFGIYDAEPDEMLALLFECWKQSKDDSSAINKTISELDRNVYDPMRRDPRC